ncbi:endothelial cell-specific chemotaxis regulator isoform X2 [Rhinatrema bivittatum]|uniref:endothelial cell-specific chemotaxis regulator isoform X2 n=1 Tax=Rhinatrema bivittatum TaxID=194408 RepID=UPI00112BDF6E|nr:endothelial cell-specific chemotaxis regulator isoform X2 [Rhinatrema bivittatum]
MESTTMPSLVWIVCWAMIKDGTCTAENVSSSSIPGVPQNEISVVPGRVNQTEPLTMVAFGGIIFIVILITGVIILVSVVSLRFKCKRSSDPEDKARAEGPVPMESSMNNGEQSNITLIAMRSLNLDNAKLKSSQTTE